MLFQRLPQTITNSKRILSPTLRANFSSKPSPAPQPPKAPSKSTSKASIRAPLKPLKPLQYFILRSQSLSLYRRYLKLVYSSLPEASPSADLLEDWPNSTSPSFYLVLEAKRRFEQEKTRNLANFVFDDEEELRAKRLLYQGEKEIQKLRETLSMGL